MKVAQNPGDFSAVGLAFIVRDMEKSTRFYCDGLGFIQGDTAERGDEVAPYLELETVKLRIRYLGRADARIELVELANPGVIGGKARRPGNTVGPYMLSFQCEDPRASAARLVELGGTFVLEGKAGAQKNHDMVIVTDPDGFRIELLSMPMAVIKPLFGQKP